MPRNPSPGRLKEYEDMKRFFVHWETHIRPSHSISLDDPRHPVNYLEWIEKNSTFSEAFAGLKQAVNDTLECSEDWGKDFISLVDQSLVSAGAPTLTHLLISRSATFRRILRRKRIRDDTEYYLVSSAVSDAALQMAEDDRSVLEAMIAAYESAPNYSLKRTNQSLRD